MLEAKNLAKKYQKREVVKDISIKVDSGEIIGLLGPNGAGKTTSFYLIVGLIRPNKGQVFINQEDITSYPMDERAHKGLGYLPQEASVFRKMTVEDNLYSILELQSHLTKSQKQSKLESLLDEFKLAHIRTTLGMSLSGGERRRVEIARALTTSPKYILLDEPFAGVDPLSVIDIKDQIKHLAQKGIGILITDHNVRETLDICHRAYIVNDGQVIADGTPKELLNNQQVRRVYLGEDFQL